MEIFNLLTGWCDSLGIDKQFSVRAQRVSNPEASIADLYSHERESWRAKRSLLKMADMCIRDLAGSGKAIDAPEANINSDMTDCLGGGGVYGSPEAFMTLLHAVLNNDSRLLQAHSYDELFKPQLDEHCK